MASRSRTRRACRTTFPAIDSSRSRFGNAHPFREGNGRTQREFFDQLLSESGRGLAWNLIDKSVLHHACHVARADGDLDPLREMFAGIVDDEPAYLYD